MKSKKLYFLALTTMFFLLLGSSCADLDESGQLTIVNISITDFFSNESIQDIGIIIHSNNSKWLALNADIPLDTVWTDSTGKANYEFFNEKDRRYSTTLMIANTDEYLQTEEISTTINEGTTNNFSFHLKKKIPLTVNLKITPDTSFTSIKFTIVNDRNQYFANEHFDRINTFLDTSLYLMSGQNETGFVTVKYLKNNNTINTAEVPFSINMVDNFSMDLEL